MRKYNDDSFICLTMTAFGVDSAREMCGNCGMCSEICDREAI